MNNLVHRNCPNCNRDRPKLLFQLSFEQFIYANPTHNIDWFKSLGFTEEDKFNFVKCINCGFVYSQSKLDEKLHHEFYHIGIDRQKSLSKIFSFRKRVQLLEKWRKLLLIAQQEKDFDFSKNPLKVLDFGAGWGDFLAVAKSPGIQVYGLEFDKRKIEFAKSQGIIAGGFDYVQNHSPYQIFMCNQVLEHLDKPKDSLKELRSLLVDGAIGFISVPDFRTEILNKHIKEIELGRQPVKTINPWGHLNYFSPESLRNMIFEAGFSEISLQTRPSSKSKKYQIQKLIKEKVLRFAANKQKAKNFAYKNADKGMTTSLYIKAV